VVAGHGQHPRRNRVRADVAPVSRLPLLIDAFHHRAYRQSGRPSGLGFPPGPAGHGGVQATRRDGLLSRRPVLAPRRPIPCAARVVVPF
jgi:hypothetical protein